MPDTTAIWSFLNWFGIHKRSKTEEKTKNNAKIKTRDDQRQQQQRRRIRSCNTPLVKFDVFF